MSAVADEVPTFGRALLPSGWQEVALEDLVGPDGIFVDGDWVESKDQDPQGDVRLIQLADVGDGEYRDRSERFLTSEKARELGCTFLEAGDLLVARMPDPLGRACIFPGDRRRAVTVVDVAVVRPAKPGGEYPLAPCTASTRHSSAGSLLRFRVGALGSASRARTSQRSYFHCRPVMNRTRLSTKSKSSPPASTKPSPT